MDWSLIIFIAVTAFFSYRGYRKGLLKSLSRVLGLLAGYIAAILYSSQTSIVVGNQTPLHGITAIITASAMLFFTAAFAVAVVFWMIGKVLPQRDNNSTSSSIGGALVGLPTGLIVAVIIVWLFVFLRDMQPQVRITEHKGLQKSPIENITRHVASKAVKTALSLAKAEPEIAKLGAAMVESPADIAQQAQRLAGSNNLSTLLGDPKNQNVLNSGDVEAVKQLPAFQQLVNNPDMLALSKSAGMLDESTDNTDAMEAALATQLTDIWGRMQRVKNDQRIQAILEDPEFQQKIQSGNPVDLLTNTRLIELADIIFEDKSEDAIAESDDSNSSIKEKTIYSWTDENGKVHYSDKAPE